jgi:hypothetical protein
VIDLFVGPDRKRYVVHKKPLTSQSEYFYNAFKGDFKEAQENSIHLKEEDPVAVALLIGFIYRGVIPGTEKKISPFAQSYFPSSTEKSAVPQAELIDGSQYPFMPTSMTDPHNTLAVRDQFHNICFQPQYSMFSQEELRLADYKLGRKYFDSPARLFGGGLFGANPPPPPRTGIGLFGIPQPAPPPIIASVPGSIPAHAPSSQAPSHFGNPQPPAPPGASTTAPAQPPQRSHPLITPAPIQPGAVPSMQSTSLFGTPAPSQPVTVPSPQAGALPNNPQPGPSTQSTLTGGYATNPTPAQFLQSASPFGTFAPAGSSSLFGSLSAAAPSQPSTAPQSGSLFGGLRPTSSQIQPQQSGGLFGAPPGISSGSLFASTWGSAGIHSLVRPGATTTPWNPRFSFPRDDSPFETFGYNPIIEHPKSPGAFIPGIPRSDPMGAQTSEQQNQQLALLHLCLLAETILWPALYNAAIEAYVRGELNLHRPIPPEHVDLIYDRTHSESTLRAYVLESMCTNRGDSLMYIDLTRQYDELSK